MEPKTFGDRRVAGMNKWMVGLTVGIWAITVLVGVGALLALASLVPQRRATRWLLRLGGAATIAVAAYVHFGGAR